MASVDQVAELKKEVETLRALLEHERKKSVSATAVSPNAPEPVSLSPVKPVDTLGAQGAQSPRAFMKSPSKARSQRFEPPPQQSEMEWNEPPVGTKRGKWWLQDRQILSRNTPSRRDDCVAVKVREAWVWNGRPVIVDKIVMCALPVPRRGGEDEEDVGIREEQHRIQPLMPSAAVASFQQLALNKSPGSASSRSPTCPFRATDQPSSASAAAADGCSPVDESAAAALRLESEMRSHQGGI